MLPVVKDEEITILSENYKARIPWSHLDKFIEAPDMVFLYSSKGKGGIFFPNMEFSDEIKARMFRKPPVLPHRKAIERRGFLIAIIVIACVFLITFLDAYAPSAQKLVRGYRLERFNENGMYYIVTPKDPLNGIGVFEGTVDQIGWNQDWILARVTKSYHGDTNGWYALNVKTTQIVGPIQESELSTNKEWSQIKCCAPEWVKNKW